jgi:hypothetical protein
MLAHLPLPEQFQGDGIFRIPRQQQFEHGDPLDRTAGAEGILASVTEATSYSGVRFSTP